MACFGYSRQHNVTQDFDEEMVLKKLKKKKSWISWSRPKKSVAKTVSVSVSMPGKLDASSKSHLFKLDEVNVVPSKKHRRRPESTPVIKHTRKNLGLSRKSSSVSEINHLTSSARDDKHDKKGSSSPPENKTPTATNRADLTSLPPQKEKKKESINVENGDDNVSVKNQNREALDSIVGMSVIVMVLVLILIWGKLCATLCTAAWFYIIPRFRTAVDSNVTANNAPESDVLNLNSDEHKKKVVLEGLLQRDHRSVIRLL